MQRTANSVINRLSLSLAISCIVSFPLTSHAANDVTITPLETTVAADDRGIVTLRFEVENQTNQSLTWQETIGLPEGWELVSSPAPFPLAPKQREVRFIYVSIPRGTNSGTYPINYQVNAQGNANLNGADRVNVQIIAVAGAELSTTDKPYVLLAGDEYKITTQLKNTGNQPRAFRIYVEDEDGFITNFSPRSITLKASETADIQLAGKIPANLTKSTDHKITVVADSGKNSAEERITIPVYARTPEGLGQWQKLRGRLSLRYNYQDNKTNNQKDNWQLQYDAQGALDNEGKHRLAVYLRNGSKNQQTWSSLQEEYRATYSTNEWKVIAGHQSFYSDSRLSGLGLSNASGTTIEYNPIFKERGRPLKMRAYEGKSRTNTTTQEKSRGASIRYRFDKEQLEIGAAVVDQQQNNFDDVVKSLDFSWVVKNFSFRGDIAQDSDGKAHALDINTYWQNVNANVSYTKADAKFNGGNQDTKRLYGGLGWRMSEATRFQINFRRSENNLAQDLSKEIRHDEEHSASISHYFDKARNKQGTIGYRLRDSQDQRPTPTTNEKIKTLFAEYRHSFEQFDFTLGLEQGKRNDQIKSNNNNTGREVRMALNWRPNRQVNFNTTFSQDKGLDSNGTTRSLGINGTYKLNKRQELTGYWQQTRSNDNSSRYDSYNVGYRHIFRNDHAISFNATHRRDDLSTSTDNNDNYIWLDYTLPLDVPFKRRSNIGNIAGKAYYADTRTPAENLILDMGGYHAVTDAKGEFSYPNMLAKNYDLQIDTSRLDQSGYMLDTPTNTQSVKVVANNTQRVQIPLKQGASITGRLLAFEVNKTLASSAEKDGLVPSEGLGGLLIELQPIGDTSDKRTVQKRLTQGDGSFSFIGIPLGQWQVVVVDADKIPEQYRLEQQQVTVELEKGENEEVTIRAVPLHKTIDRVGPREGFSVSG